MGRLVPNPYSRRTVKRKLENIEGIIITDNIVSTKCTAKEVLKEFHSKNTSRMSDDDWQMHIIETVAKLASTVTDPDSTSGEQKSAGAQGQACPR